MHFIRNIIWMGMLFFLACTPKIQSIEVDECLRMYSQTFKKNKADIGFQLHIFNPNSFSVRIEVIDIDITMNQKEVGTYYSPDERVIAGLDTLTVDGILYFDPLFVFDHLKTGLIKIKSDVEEDVHASGTITYSALDEAQEVVFDCTQMVTFGEK